MASVVSHVDTREKLLEVIEPLIDEHAKSFYEEGYEDRKRDENLESRIMDTPNEK
jgi:hypothetical protein